MSRRIPSVAVVLALALLQALTGFAVAGEQGIDEEAALAETARTYVEKFLAGEYEAYVDLMSEELKTAFPPALAEQVLGQMLAVNGAAKKIGDAWPEDEVDAYRPFRVPTEFEKKTVDLRVVFDTKGEVAGFTQVLHVPSPAEMEADETLRAEANPAVEGHWEGSVEIPGPDLGVLVDLKHQDGYWVGTIDIPAQAARGVPLSGITVGKTEVQFTIAGAPGSPTFRGKLAEGAIAGEFTQGGQSFPFHLGREELAKPTRPQEPEPPFPYEEHEVSFPNGTIRLAGTLTVPRGEGGFPAALLISGSGAQDRNEEVFGHKPFLVLADHLTRAGIAVLRVDDRGVGGSGSGSAAPTSEDFAGDVLAGVKFLRTRDEIDAKKIGLIGHSEGGLIGPMVGSKSDDVAYVVLLASPGVPGSELLLRQVELLARAHGVAEEEIAQAMARQSEIQQLVESGAEEAVIRGAIREAHRARAETDISEAELEEQVARETATLASAWFRYFLSYDPRPTLRKLDVPVLALCGGKDLQVDPGQNLPEIRKALEQAGNRDFTVEEMEGLNHLFQKATTGSTDEYYTIEETMNPAALKIIAAWISERFVGEPEK